MPTQARQDRKFYPSTHYSQRTAWLDCKTWACVLLKVSGGFIALRLPSEEDLRKYKDKQEEEFKNE